MGQGKKKTATAEVAENRGDRPKHRKDKEKRHSKASSSGQKGKGYGGRSTKPEAFVQKTSDNVEVASPPQHDQDRLAELQAELDVGYELDEAESKEYRFLRDLQESEAVEDPYAGHHDEAYDEDDGGDPKPDREDDPEAGADSKGDPEPGPNDSPTQETSGTSDADLRREELPTHAVSDLEGAEGAKCDVA